MRSIVLTIRHEWAEKIYRREKLDELRKSTPRDPVFWTEPVRLVRLYEPESGRITGVFSLGACIELSEAEDVLQCRTALELPEIEAYGPGRDGRFHVWMTSWAEKFEEPLPIGMYGLKRPPQSWQYINT